MRFRVAFYNRLIEENEKNYMSPLKGSNGVIYIRYNFSIPLIITAYIGLVPYFHMTPFDPFRGDMSFFLFFSINLL